MNPPQTDDQDNGYLGSEPLDTALADRFALIVEMPNWTALSEDEQIAVIQADEAPLEAGAASALVQAIACTRAALPSVKSALADGVASYVRTLVALLAQAGLALSPRRAGMLYRSVIAVHAAAMAIDPSVSPSDSAILALRSSLPQRAQGIAVPEVKLLAAHREAWRFANINPGDPLRAILCTADPVERLRLAVAVPALAKGEFSQVIADALAQLPVGAREAAIVHLFETGAVGRLNAAVAAQAAEVYRDVATPPNFAETLHGSDTRFQTWKKVKDLLSRLNTSEPRAHLRANALAAAYVRKQLATPNDAVNAFQSFAATETRLKAA